MTVTERISDSAEVNSLFKVREEFKSIEDEIISIISSSGAILKGHFSLESGLHSGYFFRFADISSKLENIDLLSNAVLARLNSVNLDFNAIIVQPSSGRLLARALAKKGGKKLIIARVNEKDQPTGELVNDYELHPNDKVLVFEDLATTGSSMRTMIEAIRKRKAKPVAIMLFATRNKYAMNKFAEDNKLPLFVIGDLAFENKTTEKDNCVNCPADPIPSWNI